GTRKPTSPGCAGVGRTSCSPLRAWSRHRSRFRGRRYGEHGAPRAVRGGGQLVPLHSSSLVSRFPVDERRKDTLRGTAVGDGRSGILYRQIRRTLERNDSEIRALARNQRANLVTEPERAGRAEGAELERRVSGEHIRALRASARADQDAPQLLEEVE